MKCYNCDKWIEWISPSEEVFAEKNIIFCNNNCFLEKFVKMNRGFINDGVGNS